VRSIFFWRILLLLTIIVLIASLFIMGGYLYLSRDAYAELKLTELLPKAQVMEQLIEELQNDRITKEAFENLSDQMANEDNTICMVSDTDGTIIYLNTEAFGPLINRDEAEKLFRDEFQAILSGQTLQQEGVHLSDGTRAILAGIPVLDEAGSIQGAVLLFQSIEDIHQAANTMDRALILVAAIVFPLILIFSSIGFRKVTGPLHRMSDVAIQMSRGDFQVRADENAIGEVGVLARALNTLCDNLSHTIYQLRAEKGQLNLMLSSFSEGIAAIDNLGMLTHYNPALMQMFGAVKVSSRMELVPDQSIWRCFDAVLEKGEPQSMHYAMPGDRMLWITISPVVTEAGERVGVVGMFKDMTEMERLERIRRDYVANVSHELRSPLTAVRGLLEPLVDGMVTSEEDRQRYYKIMLREVLRLSRLITDTMELSRLQSGSEYMEFAQVDIREVLEDISQNYEKEAAERGIVLRLETPELPPVLTDPDRIAQVLVILIDNAMRYTPEGGTITIRAEDGPRVNITVEDTGCGIPIEDQPHVFERFYKVDKSRKEGGTGLGLSIAKFIIDKLGESIMLESIPGEGASFRFTLKKYVNNAIPLGPAYMDQVQAEPISLDPDEIQRSKAFYKDRYGREDAPYEVIKPNKAKKTSAAKKTKNQKRPTNH